MRHSSTPSNWRAQLECHRSIAASNAPFWLLSKAVMLSIQRLSRLSAMPICTQRWRQNQDSRATEFPSPCDCSDYSNSQVILIFKNITLSQGWAVVDRAVVGRVLYSLFMLWSQIELFSTLTKHRDPIFCICHLRSYLASHVCWQDLREEGSPAAKRSGDRPHTRSICSS